MKKRMSKKAQETLGISFGVLFSIILIIFFIVIAGIVIKAFLTTGDCARMGIFIDRFESDIKKSWNSQADIHVFNGNLPLKIDYVCFGNLSRSSNGEFRDIGFELGLYEGSGANTFFYPPGKACEIPFQTIDHLDITEITKINNPNCVIVEKGKVSINVVKGLNDRFVRIEI